MSTPAPMREESFSKTERWRTLLHDAAIEVFSMMLGTELGEVQEPYPTAVTEVTAMVGMAGALSGILSIRCSAKISIEIASRMLGLDPAEAEVQRYDAVGETCNMVAGAFKAKNPDLQTTCMLSVPTVIVGDNYSVFPLVAGERVDVPLMFDDEMIWIGLETRD